MSFIFCKKAVGFEKLNATVQWTVAAASSKTGGYYSETNPSHSDYIKSRTATRHGDGSLIKFT